MSLIPSAKVGPARVGRAAASPAAPPSGQAAGSALDGDTFSPTGKPENWRVQSTTTISQVYERAKAAAGKAKVSSGQHVVEDIRETNLDTGEVHLLHSEETDSGKHHAFSQEFTIRAKNGQVLAHDLQEGQGDGSGPVHNHEETEIYQADGKLKSHSVKDWDS